MRQPTQREINRVFSDAFITSKRSPPARRQRALRIVAALHERYADESRRFFQWAIHDLHRRAVAGQPAIASLYLTEVMKLREAGFDVPELPKENDR